MIQRLDLGSYSTDRPNYMNLEETDKAKKETAAAK